MVIRALLITHQILIFHPHKQVHIQVLVLMEVVKLKALTLFYMKQEEMLLSHHKLHLMLVVVFGTHLLHKLEVLLAQVGFLLLDMVGQNLIILIQIIFIWVMVEIQSGMMVNQTLRLQLMNHQHQEHIILN